MSNIRFGPRSVQGQHPAYPGRVHGIVPGNAGISHAAQDRIDLLTSAATRRAKEAISGIDAVRLFIWQPLKHGPACNCGTDPLYDTTPDPSANPYVLGIVEDKMDSADELKPRLRVKSRDVTAYDSHTATNPHASHGLDEDDDVLGVTLVTSTRGNTDPYTEDSTSSGPYEGPMHGTNGLYLHQGSYDHEMPDSNEDEYGEVLISEYENDAWNPDSILADNAFVLGSSTMTCPVCFGIGILGGYSLFGATRLVLSSANATGGNSLGSDDSIDPPSFDLNPGEYVEWSDLKCPNYFSFGWAISRFLRGRSDAVITYSLDDTTWKPIEQLQSDNAVNLSTLAIRVTNTGTQNAKFSHADITLFHSDVLGQVTNFNLIAGLAAAIKGDGITITLPPEVGIIDRNALIGDSKYKLMWRVTTVTPISTAQMQVISCELMTELMEPSLVETILYPHYSVEGQAQKTYGNGVEPVQGMR